MKKIINSKLSEKEDFENLFGSYHGKIVRFITHIVKSEEVAADIAQNVFLKLWESREELNIKDSVSLYIYKTAKNMTLNYLRSKRIEQTYLEWQASMLPELYHAEGEYEMRDTLARIRTCVFAMPQPRREIFILSRKAGQTNVQIATQLGMSVKNVEYHLSKALAELRKIVKI